MWSCKSNTYMYARILQNITSLSLYKFAIEIVDLWSTSRVIRDILVSRRERNAAGRGPGLSARMPGTPRPPPRPHPALISPRPFSLSQPPSPQTHSRPRAKYQFCLILSYIIELAASAVPPLKFASRHERARRGEGAGGWGRRGRTGCPGGRRMSGVEWVCGHVNVRSGVFSDSQLSIPSHRPRHSTWEHLVNLFLLLYIWHTWTCVCTIKLKYVHVYKHASISVYM